MNDEAYKCHTPIVPCRLLSRGGGIYLENFEQVTVSRSNFTRNQVITHGSPLVLQRSHGSAVYVVGITAKIQFQSCLFLQQTAVTRPGSRAIAAVFLTALTNAAPAIFDSCTFTNNAAWVGNNAFTSPVQLIRGRRLDRSITAREDGHIHRS
jgi:hypothetical protein